MRHYERKIVASRKWTPIELGLAIALYDFGYDLTTMKRRWFRDRSEDAIWDQLAKFHPKQRADPTKVDWNPQLVDQLVMLWLRGDSSMQISRRLDITRNAVIGKLNTLNLIPQQAIDYGKNPHIQSAQEAYPGEVFVRGRT